jgi:hypothetical protein
MFEPPPEDLKIQIDNVSLSPSEKSKLKKEKIKENSIKKIKHKGISKKNKK